MSGSVDAGGGMPNDIWGPVRPMIDLDDENFDALIDALAPTHRTRSDISAAVLERVTGLSKRQVTSGLGAAIGYIAGWLSAGKPGDEPIEARAARRAYPDDSDLESRGRVERLLAQPSIRLAAGATAASISRGQEVSALSLGIDLTPMQWTDALGSAVLPSFLLTFDVTNYAEPETDSVRKSIVLDLYDVRALRDQVTRVLEDLENLERRYSEAGIIVWGIDSEDGDE